MQKMFVVKSCLSREHSDRHLWSTELYGNVILLQQNLWADHSVKVLQSNITETGSSL